MNIEGDSYIRKERREIINWKVRFSNGSWVIALLSQTILIVQMLLTGLHSLGVTEFQLTDDFKNDVLSIANTIFAFFSFIGIIQDPTTKGYSDSAHALTYEKPK